MKKLLMILLVMFVVGCNGAGGVSQEDYEALYARVSIVEKFSEDLSDVLFAKIDDLEDEIMFMHETDKDLIGQVTNHDNRIWDMENVREVGFDVYCDDEPMNDGAIEHKFATIRGSWFNASFSVANNGLINEPCDRYYFVPHDQPSGYVNRYTGFGEMANNQRGYYIFGKAEWRRMTDSRWGIRIEFSNYSIETGTVFHSGALYAGKRSPGWTAMSGDWIHVYVELP